MAGGPGPDAPGVVEEEVSLRPGTVTHLLRPRVEMIARGSQ